jgi:plasmid replication initiation protein
MLFRVLRRDFWGFTLAFDGDPFYISAVEYSKIFGVDQKNVHREIKKAVAELWDA